MQIFGALFLSIVVGYVAVMAAQLRRQFVIARQAEELSLKLLQTQLEAASLLKSQREESQLMWNGFRDFQVHGTVGEAKNITSFYLLPHDGKSLPKFQPGQSLILRLLLPGSDDPIERRYPISSSPSPDYFRITLRRTVGDPVSDFLHKEVTQHTILKVGAPRGEFCIDPTLYRPLALIADDVGIAPFMSMIESVVATHARRSITLIYSVRNQEEHAMRHRLNELEDLYHNLRVITVFQDGAPSIGCDHTGSVSIEMLQSLLKSNNFEFFVCGSNSMVTNTKSALRRWGVSRWNLFTEAIETEISTAAESTSSHAVPASTPAPETRSVVSSIRNAANVVASTPATKTATAAALVLVPAAVGSLG
jgi:ferredoxin-NADP reductase